jgi:hypothetical protein
VIAGDDPLPDSVGGYVGLAGDLVSDPLAVVGTLPAIGGSLIGDSLIWYGEDGGPIGLGIEGLGHTIKFGTNVAGTIVSGAGDLVEGVTDGVGDAVDAVGNAAEDAWDTVSGWF